MEKIKDFGISVGQEVIYRIKNPNQKNTSNQRMQVCQNCPHFSNYRCRVCGCFLFIKVRFLTSRCPLGLW